MTLTYSNLVPSPAYDPGDFDVVKGTAPDRLLADSGSVQIARYGTTIVGKDFTTDLTDCISAYRLANDAGSTTIFDGRCDRRISFDASGNAYTLVQVGLHTDPPEQFLCCSTDNGVTWTAYLLSTTMKYAQIEANNSQTLKPLNPPAIAIFDDSTLKVIIPTIAAGVVNIPAAITISTSSLLTIQHTGTGNILQSVDKTTFPNIAEDVVLIAWPKNEATPGDIGTNQYLTTISRASQQVKATYLIGTSGTLNGPDNHDIPTIALDSIAQLHCFLGCHHDNLNYTKAAYPWASWTAPVIVSPRHVSAPDGHSYPSLVIDAEDRLYVVSRDAKTSYNFNVVLNKCDSAGVWATQETLVAVGRAQYSNAYYGLCIDRFGRLILTSAGILWSELSSSEATTYNSLWAGELPAGPPYYPDGGWAGPYASQNVHGPFVLISDNRDTWRTAQTSEIIMSFESILTSFAPTVVFNTADTASPLVASSDAGDNLVSTGTGHLYEQDSIISGVTTKCIKSGASGGIWHDAAAQAVTAPNNVKTFLTFIKPTVAFAAEAYIVNRCTAAATANYGVTLVRVDDDNAKVKAYWKTTTGSQMSAITNNAVINRNSSHMIAVVSLATGIEIYVDAVRQSVTVGTDAPYNFGFERLAICGQCNSFNPLNSCFIQYPMFFNYALNTPYIAALKNGAIQQYSAIVDPDGIVEEMSLRLRTDEDPISVQVLGNSNAGWANQPSGNANYGRVFGWVGGLTGLGHKWRGTGVLMPGVTPVTYSDHRGTLANAPYDMSIITAHGAGTGAPAGADAFWNPDGEGTTNSKYIGPWAYRYIASGGSIDSTLGRLWANYITLRAATCPIMGHNLLARYWYVEGPYSSPGQFRPAAYQSGDIKLGSVVDVTAVSYARAMATLELDSGEYAAGSNLLFTWGANANGSVLGDICSLGIQIVSRDIGGGFTVSPLYAVGGADVTYARDALANLQDESLISYWQMVCEDMTDPWILIDFTWGINEITRISHQTLITAAITTITRLRATFTAAGFDASKMHIMLANDQPMDPSNVAEDLYVQEVYHDMIEVMNSVGDAFVVGRHLVNDYATYIANDWDYNTVGNHHLSLPTGYDGEQLGVLQAIGLPSFSNPKVSNIVFGLGL